MENHDDFCFTTRAHSLNILVWYLSQEMMRFSNPYKFSHVTRHKGRHSVHGEIYCACKSAIVILVLKSQPTDVKKEKTNSESYKVSEFQ